MPRYFFDLHAGSLSEWDDEGMEAADIGDAIAIAKDMLVVANGDLERLHGDRHAVVMIRDRDGNHAATLTAVQGGEPRIILASLANRA